MNQLEYSISFLEKSAKKIKPIVREVLKRMCKETEETVGVAESGETDMQ